MKVPYQRSFLLLFCVSVIVYSCSSRTVPIHGTYSNKHADTVSIASTDSLWSKVLDFCSEEGLSIKTIDRQGGIIVVDKHDTRCTFETEELTYSYISDTTALVLLSKQLEGKMNKTAANVNSEWNIRVKSLESGKATLEVYLIYARNQNVYSTKYDTYLHDYDLYAFSTGQMEKKMFAYVSR